MLIAADHSRHPIVRRQLATLVAAGYAVSVLDGAGLPDQPLRHAYERVHVRPASVSPVARIIWRVLRRVAPGTGEAFWTTMHILDVLIATVSYTRRALSVDAEWYQAHDIDTLPAAWIAARLRHRRVIYDAHELVSEQGDPRTLRKRFERILEELLVPRVDELVVPSPARAQFYQQRCNLRRAPKVVLNCAPSADIVRTNVLRERLGLAPGTRLVLYHGTFMPGRALEHLLLAAREFDAGTVLVMIGEQNVFFDEVLRPLYETEHLKDKVHFIPFIPPDQMMEYVASADLGVVIYRNINLNNYLCAPTKLYEYVMAGVPMVASDFPDLAAFLREFPAGRTFDPERPASIAAAVNAFFRLDDSERLNCSQVLGRARRIFTWEREGQKLLHMFARPAHTSA